MATKDFKKLATLVTDFNGDAIASCFKNKLVKKIESYSDTTLFQTVDGELFYIYTSKLK
jgi:hypothetical protein